MEHLTDLPSFLLPSYIYLNAYYALALIVRNEENSLPSGRVFRVCGPPNDLANPNITPTAMKVCIEPRIQICQRRKTSVTNVQSLDTAFAMEEGFTLGSGSFL